MFGRMDAIIAVIASALFIATVALFSEIIPGDKTIKLHCKSCNKDLVALDYGEYTWPNYEIKDRVQGVITEHSKGCTEEAYWIT